VCKALSLTKALLPLLSEKLGFVNLSEYLATYDIQMDQLVMKSQKDSSNLEEDCVVHVGAVIHKYHEEGAIWSRKCNTLTWKDCPGECTKLSTHNADFCTQVARVAGTSARRLGHPAGRYFFERNRLLPSPRTACVYRLLRIITFETDHFTRETGHRDRCASHSSPTRGLLLENLNKVVALKTWLYGEGAQAHEQGCKDIDIAIFTTLLTFQSIHELCGHGWWV